MASRKMFDGEETFLSAGKAPNDVPVSVFFDLSQQALESRADIAGPVLP